MGERIQRFMCHHQCPGFSLSQFQIILLMSKVDKDVRIAQYSHKVTSKTLHKTLHDGHVCQSAVQSCSLYHAKACKFLLRAGLPMLIQIITVPLCSGEVSKHLSHFF